MKIDLGPVMGQLQPKNQLVMQGVLEKRFNFFMARMVQVGKVVEGKPLKGCPRTKYLSTKFSLPVDKYANDAQPWIYKSLCFLADQVTAMPGPIEYYVMPPEENCRSYFVWEHEEACLRQYDRIVLDGEVETIETHFDLFVRFAEL